MHFEKSERFEPGLVYLLHLYVPVEYLVNLRILESDSSAHNLAMLGHNSQPETLNILWVIAESEKTDSLSLL